MLPRSCQDRAKIVPRSCQAISRLYRRSCQDIQHEIQDLAKKSKIDSKNIFVEHVVLLQATLPETEQYPYSEVEALC